ncbi:unnamed protein product, partial [Meganyctiphanes norvegica]
MDRIQAYMIQLWKNITIEPLMVIYYAALNVMELFRTDMKLERFCRVINNHTAEECENIHDHENRYILYEAQKQDGIFGIMEYTVGDIVPVIMLLFLSTWSDRNGRRLVMLMPLVGCMAYSFTYFLAAIFTSWSPIILLIGSFLRSLSGSHMLFLMGAYAYMADLTSHGARTTRMAVLTALMSLGSPIGTMLGPVIFNAADETWGQSAGYQCVFGTATLLFIVTFIITFIVVKDRPMVTNIDEDQTGNCFQMGWRNVSGLWNSAFKKRPQNRRMYILVLVAMMLLNICAIPQKLYVWSQIVLDWDIDDYSPYWSLRSLLAHIMILVLTPLIRNTGIHDCLTAAGSVGLKAIKTIMMTMVSSPSGAWVLWATVWMPDGLESLAIRSLLTKVCEPFEVGRMMALLAVTEAIWPILDIFLYTIVYNSTIEYWPSAVYVMSSAFGLLVLALLLWMRLDMQKNGMDEEFEKAAAKYTHMKNESVGDLSKCEQGEDSNNLEEKSSVTQNISNLIPEISVKEDVNNQESNETPTIED